MSALGQSLTNCSAWRMSGIGPEAEVDEYALLGFDPNELAREYDTSPDAHTRARTGPK